MTHKEIAERLRDMSNRVGSLTQSSLAELADDLDPPRPEPGTVVWWRVAADDKWRLGCVLNYGIVPVDNLLACWNWDFKGLEYKPARIAGPMQEIVDIPPVSEWPRGANAVNAVYETGYIGTTYIGEIITRDEAARREDRDDGRNR